MATVPVFAIHKGSHERPSLRQIARQLLYVTYLAVLFLEVVERHGFCIPLVLVLGFSAAGHLHIAVWRHLRDSAHYLANWCHFVLLWVPTPSRQGLQQMLYAALLLEMLAGPWRSLPAAAHYCILGVVVALSAARLASRFPRLPCRRQSPVASEVDAPLLASSVPRPTRWLMERLLLGVLSVEMLLNDQWPRALWALLSFLAKVLTACLGLWLSGRYMPAVGRGVVMPVCQQLDFMVRLVHDRIRTGRLEREYRHLTQWPPGVEVFDAHLSFSAAAMESKYLASMPAVFSREKEHPAMSSEIFSEISDNFQQWNMAAHAEMNFQRLTSGAAGGFRYGHGAVQTASSTVYRAVRRSAAIAPMALEAAFRAAGAAVGVASDGRQAAASRCADANVWRHVEGPVLVSSMRAHASAAAAAIVGVAAAAGSMMLAVLAAPVNVLPAAVRLLGVVVTALSQAMIGRYSKSVTGVVRRSK